MVGTCAERPRYAPLTQITDARTETGHATASVLAHSARGAPYLGESTIDHHRLVH
jgi:hypothetical protein